MDFTSIRDQEFQREKILGSGSDPATRHPVNICKAKNHSFEKENKKVLFTQKFSTVNLVKFIRIHIYLLSNEVYR